MPQKPRQLHTEQAEQVSNWIRHHVAAAMMHTNEKNLRVRDRTTGEYIHWPKLRRIRNGKYIYLLRSEVQEWVEAVERAALPTATAPLDTFEPLREQFRTKPKLARQLGL